MGALQSYSLFLLKHPSKLLFLGSGLVLALFLITLHLRPLQSFKDPLIGFEARGTYISSRINTWKLLLDETSASANYLSISPNSETYDGDYYNSFKPFRLNNELNSVDNFSVADDLDVPKIEMSIQQVLHNTTASNNIIMDDGEAEYYQSVNSSQGNLPALLHNSLGSSKAFCGKLYEGYAQAVVTQTTNISPHGLFNLNSILAICQLDKNLRLEDSPDNQIFRKDCEQYNNGSTTRCCNSWSLPNYITCLTNKTTCMDIDSHDLNLMDQLLNSCAPYYIHAPHEECFVGLQKDKKSQPTEPMNLLSTNGLNSGLSRKNCGSIPDKCLDCDGWIFTVMNYLINENFVKFKQPQTGNLKQHRINQAKDFMVGKLTHTNIFLPVAKSSSLLKYYHALPKHSFKTPFAQVKVLNLGLKNSLFEYLVSDDLKLFVIALTCILLVISIYTWSFILSLVILKIICLSLCLSYTIYELAFNIPIFPFMNLLAIVISFGICSDNAMLFCKHWSMGRQDEANNSPIESSNDALRLQRQKAALDRMLRKAIISTSAATLATACSFIISAISKVIAVRCFCIFATLSVVTNYLLIVLLLPPALILDSRLKIFLNSNFNEHDSKVSILFNFAQFLRTELLKLGEVVHQRWILSCVTQFKFYLIITFGTVLICSSILVFYSPTLRPVDEDDIQLFSKKHIFEQYNKNMRNQFQFEKLNHGQPVVANKFDALQEIPETLPIRVVFGVKPIDNGNQIDPHDRGSLVFDSKFDFTDPNVQTWLKEFCQTLTKKEFVHPSSASERTNCFIESFKSWMDARDCRDPVDPLKTRNPCCSESEFPYSGYVIDKCIGEAVGVIRKTPRLHPSMNAGVRFFKNSTRVAAIIIEYQSNRFYSGSFKKMDRFFNDIDEEISWYINNTAPPGLKSGWFISSDLELLALQTELEHSTTTSILLELLFATVALIASTHDFVLTIAGTLAIGSVIISTLAVLILLNWTLGVAESILISLTIGLSVDFALHYSVAYSEGLSSKASFGVIHRILGEVGSPIALATITTGLAGFIIIWSEILAYQELGVFLMLIAIVSWTTCTFFLLPMLAAFDLTVSFGEQYFRQLLQRLIKILVDRL